MGVPVAEPVEVVHAEPLELTQLLLDGLPDAQAVAETESETLPLAEKLRSEAVARMEAVLDTLGDAVLDKHSEEDDVLLLLPLAHKELLGLRVMVTEPEYVVVSVRGRDRLALTVVVKEGLCVALTLGESLPLAAPLPVVLTLLLGKAE